jgi:ABC-type nitrate/sulfonate/bicarbonate transport system permease component
VLSSPQAGTRLRRLAVPVVSILGGLALWQFVIAVFHPNPLAIVGPADIVRGAVGLARDGTLGPDVGLSLVQLGAGLVIAVVGGALAGLLLGTNRWVSGAVGPWVTALYTIPVIAVAPLVIVGLGLGTATKIAIVAASGFFPIAINTQAGAVQVSEGALRDVARSFRADRIETLCFLTVPGAVPHMLTGIRLAIGRALIALVAADLFGSTSGLGYLIISGQQNLRTADVYVGVVALSVIGMTLTSVVAVLERRMADARSSRAGRA